MPITSGTLGTLRAVRCRGADVVFSFESSELVLTAIMPNVVRHSWVPRHWRLHTQKASDGYAVRRTIWPGATAEIITETPREIRVRAGDLVIEAEREPFRLRYSTPEGKMFLEEAGGGGLSWSYWDYTLRYQLTAEDHFYGIGQPDQLAEHLGLDHRGRVHEVWNQHTPPASTIFPTLLNLRGYGLLIDNPYRATWDLGYTDPLSFSYHARGGPLQYYVFHGSNLRDLLKTYLELTGFPPLPPRWVFGLLQSRYGYRSRQELEAIAEMFRTRDLPCDALILDLFWFREMGDLAFNPAHWPNPSEMIARLREQGFRTMVIEEPYLTVKSGNYPEALAKGYLARHYDSTPYIFKFWPGECGLVDFSNPEACAWWTEKHRALLELGIGGWWTDLNEPTKHLEDMAHHGGSASATHNLTALSMHQAIFDAYQRYAPSQRPFILSRSGFPGSQRYGAGLWSGDVQMTFAALRKQPAVGLSAGLAGISLWGSDIGGFGFGGRCTPELYVRWFQFGAFSPLCRPHGDQTELREPWQFGAEVEAICRKYLRLRYRLMPYIYTAAREACTSGVPLMRALVLDFPGDAEVLNMSDQYLFGPDILVAPILDEGATRRDVYLPDGAWVDFWTEEVHGGPRFLAVSAPLDTLPLFVRQGAILPMAPDARHCGERLLDPLFLEIYRGADRTITLYEDDGETTSYQTGACAQTRLEVSENAGALSLLIGEPQGSFAGFQRERGIVVNIHQQPPTSEVSCNGAPLAACASARSLEQAPRGWWWNRASGILTVKPGRTTGPIVLRIL